jgi:MtN3 and saliva related transmembrane protein
MEIKILIGYIATVAGWIAFVPQIIKSIRARETKDISLAMYVIFWLGNILWFVYGLFSHNYPVMVNNAIMFPLTSIMLFLKIKFK